MKKKKFYIISLVCLLAILSVANAINLYDGFEDGDYTNNPSWTSINIQGSESISNSVVYEGLNSLQMTTIGAAGSLTLYTPVSSNMNYYDSWFNSTDVTKNDPYFIIGPTITRPQGIRILFSHATNTFQYRLLAGGFNNLSPAVGMLNNTWYRCRIGYVS